MLHGSCSGPIRIVLMPGYNTAMFCRFAEQLIMPEADSLIAQKLMSRHQKCRIPEDVMKPRSYSPMTKGVKNNPAWIGRFIGMEFIKQIVIGMIRVHNRGKLPVKLHHMILFQKLYSRNISVFVKKRNLFLAKPEFFPFI